MDCQIAIGRAVSAAALSFSLMTAVGAAWTGSEPAAQPYANMSCMAIANTVKCIQTGYVPVAPIPPMIISGGSDVEGSDEDIVIRDDGGHHEVRG